ncbi:MAG: Dihydroorotate dehydrogenase 2 [Candidatus Uhrbacteria bacterium GW2011_GWF2_41_16]|uniref:Dihydroorotate dehydrogenase (quinone) n=2 Tax=Candidatus Uhriibacteriota TaxID=1752732 RepID=A0A0G0VF16_9BACT|nr:MAG: Dihydroorotate dehydrogenase 2 [Candidatus Uhrbacteria bacterium GW2011_GWC2_41_11]KKR98251.1 MAG: Dihydroorotate dehydrogenase 2 [Candidatus Uhrbacteria bacterium GW2011_GWF2_41_16]HBO99834.1 quinone-dependent dihydroorotate dehydrogenase [Candidatus Uhrbacteria bacterium]
MFATRFQRWMYLYVAKPFFFQQDPEKVHDNMTRFGKMLGHYSFTRKATSFLYQYKHPALEQNILGIHFSNPIGLTAGFDKDAHLTRILPYVGFGFEEIGSVTGEPCLGNPKPRLWRLPKSKGLVVYYGLKNDGAEAIVARLKKETFGFPIGISVAKTNNPSTVETDAGIADYIKAMKTFVEADIGDYFTVNVSCPNAYGGEPFSTPERLDLLLEALDKVETKKPIFVKLSADTDFEKIDKMVEVTDRHRVHGFVLTNLTKNRQNPLIRPNEIAGIEKGGMSGKPIFDLSNHLISHLYQSKGDRYVIMGSGGVFSAEDAYEKICLGASLIQLVTGMIFEGPQLIGEINQGLVGLLERDGFTSIHEAIGSRYQKKQENI